MRLRPCFTVMFLQQEKLRQEFVSATEPVRDYALVFTAITVKTCHYHKCQRKPSSGKPPSSLWLYTPDPSLQPVPSLFRDSLGPPCPPLTASPSARPGAPLFCHLPPHVQSSLLLVALSSAERCYPASSLPSKCSAETPAVDHLPVKHIQAMIFWRLTSWAGDGDWWDKPVIWTPFLLKAAKWSPKTPAECFTLQIY